MNDIVTVVALIADRGAVVVFATDDGRTIAVDHRPAQALADAIAVEPVEVEVEWWQVTGADPALWPPVAPRSFD